MYKTMCRTCLRTCPGVLFWDFCVLVFIHTGVIMLYYMLVYPIRSMNGMCGHVRLHFWVCAARHVRTCRGMCEGMCAGFRDTRLLTKACACICAHVRGMCAKRGGMCGACALGLCWPFSCGRHAERALFGTPVFSIRFSHMLYDLLFYLLKR